MKSRWLVWALGGLLSTSACAGTSADDSGSTEQGFSRASLVSGLFHSWPGAWREDMHNDVPAVVVRGKTLYAVVRRQDVEGEPRYADVWYLGVVDVTDPKAPIVKDGVELFRDQAEPQSTNVQLAMSGDRLFVVDESRISVLDISSSPQPVRLGSWNLTSATNIVRNVNDIVASGNYLYIAAESGVFVVDTTLADGPDVVAKIEHADADVVYAGGIAIDGSTLYVGDRHVGVRVFDVSDPLAPVSRGATSGFEGNLVRMQGSNVLVTGLEGRPGRQFAVLRKYDLSDPADPVLVSSIRTGATPYALAAGSSCAYVGFGMPNQTALIVDTGGTTMTAKSTLLAEVDTIALTTSRNLVVASRRHYGVDLHRVTCR